jgi:hypothetical protein
MRGTKIATALAILCAGACGQVEFIPSPYTPQNLSMRYSPDEDLSVLRWQITATGDDMTGTTFDLLQSDGSWKPIQFGAAPYASGTYPCNGLTCAQLVLRGRYPFDVGGLSPVRAHSPDGFVVPGMIIRQSALQIRPSLTVSAVFAADNLSVDVAIADLLFEGGPLARHFAMAVWPQGSGECTQPLSPDVLVAGTTANAPVAQPLTPEGRYCAAVHGTPDDGGRFLRVGAAALSHPETIAGVKNYQPASEQAPVLLQLILDLAIADPTRCQQVRDTLLSTLRAACNTAATGGSFHEFALIDLAPNCQRTDSRGFDPVGLADSIKQYVRQNVTQVNNRVVLFYANNLASPVPSTLNDELAQLPMMFVGDARVRTYYWSMTAAGATMNVAFDLPGVWTAIEDPTFMTSIQMAAAANLPFMTQLHDDNTMIELLDPQMVQTERGGFLKICTATPPVQLATGGTPQTTNDVGIDPAAPPGFFVQLPPKITVPHQSFASDDVIVRWEICRRWCDHPFKTDTGIAGDSWRSSSECVHSQ